MKTEIFRSHFRYQIDMTTEIDFLRKAIKVTENFSQLSEP